jgi:class 3 adenylate cyclase
VSAPYRKSLETPDEELAEGGVVQRLVEIGDFTVGYVTHPPGWRWSEHMRPLVGTDWCEARHVGVVLSGRLGVTLRDGTRFEAGPYEVYDVPPGHDAWVIGDEELVSIDWAGLESWTGFRSRLHDRVLAGLLMTDLVGSTGEAARMGDARWRRRVADYFEAIRAQLDKFKGREIDTAGDGMFALFDGAGRALSCAVAIQDIAARHEMPTRIGVHVGEVELANRGARGIAVHETARIAAAAGPGEILLSETTKALVSGGLLAFEDRGIHQLKGIAGPRHLYALARNVV